VARDATGGVGGVSGWGSRQRFFVLAHAPDRQSGVVRGCELALICAEGEADSARLEALTTTPGFAPCSRLLGLKEIDRAGTVTSAHSRATARVHLRRVEDC
jgi:hypothetical protein